MSPVEYGQWYYLIYLVPGGTALLTLMLSMMGGGVRHHRVGGHSGGHHHGGLRVAHHHHHGGHIRAGGSRAHQAARSGAKVKAATSNIRASIGDQMLALVGFGKIPSPFVWGSLLLGWSVFGFWTTRILEETMRHPAVFILPAMVTGVVGAIGMARLTSGVLSRVLPSEGESLAVSTIDLCGLTGTVTYPVDANRGRVHVYDDHGTMHDCRAKTVPGGLPVDRGRKILVIDYDTQQDQLIVEESA